MIPILLRYFCLLVLTGSSHRAPHASVAAMPQLVARCNRVLAWLPQLLAGGNGLTFAAFCRVLCAACCADRACVELSKLSQLLHLNLSQNRHVGDTGLRALAGGLGQHLEVLNLSYTSITDASVQALASMKVRRAVRPLMCGWCLQARQPLGCLLQQQLTASHLFTVLSAQKRFTSC